ncbi:MAG: DUF72 domain-containing protein [Thermoleophilia bacterium]|nr:DUF72 domain-containing protein [Thermoleophilia bacterium]
MTATPSSVEGAYVGTAGFSYATWRGGFYPADARPEEFLSHYAARLPSVELNTVFYRLPSEEQFRRWAEQTPPGFRFAVKMNRRISHAGRFEHVGTFCEQVRTLGDKLGPIRIQLPANRERDDGLLALLLGSLDPALEYAWELEHPSWDSVGGLVRVNDLDAAGPFRYLRLRDPPYHDAELARLAARLRPLLADGVRVYCYFKHEDDPRGALYAERLVELLSEAP